MTHINQRRDYAANWTSTNPVLQLGEVGWERDTRKAKLGDGVTAWRDLPYAVHGAMTKADLGLGNVDNTSDLNKPISTATQSALNGKAPLASPAFTGDPTAPTPAAGDNDTSIATTAFVKTAVDTASAVKAPLASPVFTGDPKAPTPAASDNDTSIATTAFVKGQTGPLDTRVTALEGPRSVQTWALAGTYTSTVVGSWTPVPDAAGFYFAFVAPKSGMVDLRYSCFLKPNADNIPCITGFEVRTGSARGAGSVVLAAQNGPGAVANYNLYYVRGTGAEIITDLTPGSTYHIRQMAHHPSGTGHIITGGAAQLILL